MDSQILSWMRIDSCTSVPVNSSVIIKDKDIYTQVSCNQQISYPNGIFSSPQNSIVRMSSSGNYKTSVGNFQHLENFAVDSLGNIYVIGKDSLIDNAFYSCCKFDSVGNLLWHFPIGTMYGVDVRYTVLVSDGFVFGGDWITYAGMWGGSFNLFIAKTDFNGNVKFLHKFDNHNTGRIDNIIKSGNNILVAGSFGDTLIIKDSTNSITLNGYQEYLAKYSLNGVLLSAKAISNTVCTYSMTTDLLGNVVFGDWNNTLGLNLNRYSDTGALISSEHIADAGNGSFIEKLKYDLQGNLYVMGSFRDSIVLNNSQTFYSQDLDSKPILFRRNAIGINDWTIYPDCPNCSGGFDFSDNCDFVFNTFYWDSTEVFGSNYYHSKGNILLKLQCDNMNSVSDVYIENNPVVVFPNPSAGIFNLSLKNSIEISKIRIYDLLGNCLWSKTYKTDTNVEIDLSSHSKGIYFVEVVSNGKKSISKIVLQ